MKIEVKKETCSLVFEGKEIDKLLAVLAVAPDNLRQWAERTSARIAHLRVVVMVDGYEIVPPGEESEYEDLSARKRKEEAARLGDLSE